MAAKQHITVAEIHENNAADLEKVTLIKKMNFEVNVNNIRCVKSHFLCTTGSLTVYLLRKIHATKPPYSRHTCTTSL